eukprot:scaffold9176_cov129-Cylindrotheca_fusiformis.AAC.13
MGMTCSDACVGATTPTPLFVFNRNAHCQQTACGTEAQSLLSKVIYKVQNNQFNMGADSINRGFGSSPEVPGRPDAPSPQDERQKAQSKQGKSNLARSQEAIPDVGEDITLSEGSLGECESHGKEQSSNMPRPLRMEKTLPLNTSGRDKPTEDKDTEDKSRNGSKKDRKLRKGKWTVEEEEYTSRIIHHFSTGVLTLPEGSTLRSYLADRLNCDPMRITKKFTGACCLGRRVYHLRDRPRASPAEVAMAKAELSHLEQRFRMRVEQENTGVPLTQRQEMYFSQRNDEVATLPIPSPSPVGLLRPWVQGYSEVTRPGQYQLGSIVAPANPFLMPTAVDSVRPNRALSTMPQDEGSMQFLHNIVNSLAWAQAKASLSPAVAMLQQQQKSQNEEHRRQLLTAYQEQQKEQQQRQLLEQKLREVQNSTATQKTVDTYNMKQGTRKSGKSEIVPDISPAQQLQRSYEAHLESLKKLPSQLHVPAETSSANQTRQVDDETIKSSQSIATLLTNNKEREDEMTKSENREKEASEAARDEKNDYEEAGTILLGFINSLRQSYEDAVEEKETLPREKPKPQGKKRAHKLHGPMELQCSTDYPPQSQNRTPPASVTDTSTLARSEVSSGTYSQPTESSSSIEDSDSKSDKTDPSSSEESDFPTNQRQSGPPRKRLKANRMVKEITAQNLAEHSKRMSEEFSAEKGTTF